jgi:hypothetical protein
MWHYCLFLFFIFDTPNRNSVFMNKLPYTDELPPLLGPTSWLPSLQIQRLRSRTPHSR